MEHMSDDYTQATGRACDELRVMLDEEITDELGRVCVFVNPGETAPLEPNEQQDTSTYQHTISLSNINTVAPLGGGEDRDGWDYEVMVTRDAIIGDIVHTIANASTHIYTTISVLPIIEDGAVSGCTIVIRLAYIVPLDGTISRIARAIYTSMETALTTGYRAHTLHRGCAHPITTATRWTSDFFTEGGIELSVNTMMDVTNPLVLDNWCASMDDGRDVYVDMVRTTELASENERFLCTLTA